MIYLQICDHWLSAVGFGASTALRSILLLSGEKDHAPCCAWKLKSVAKQALGFSYQLCTGCFSVPACWSTRAPSSEQLRYQRNITRLSKPPYARREPGCQNSVQHINTGSFCLDFTSSHSNVSARFSRDASTYRHSPIILSLKPLANQH